MPGALIKNDLGGLFWFCTIDPGSRHLACRLLFRSQITQHWPVLSVGEINNCSNWQSILAQAQGTCVMAGGLSAGSFPWMAGA